MRFGFGGSGGRRRAGSSPPASAAAYSVAARIAAIRASAAYGATFSGTSDPLAPSGAQLPTAPSTTTTANVSTLADLRAAIASGAHVTLAPGTYTETGRTLFDVAAGVVDCKITLTGCTLNITGNYHSFTTSGFCQRIEIVGGTFNAIPEMQGIDVRWTAAAAVADGLIANTNANGTGTGVCGHRILWDNVSAEGYNGLFYVGAYLACNFTGSISGTTLTVTAVSNGALRPSASLYTFSGAAFASRTKIVQQLTGTTGSTGTYEVSISQTRASGGAVTYERPTNCWAMNCNLRAITAVDNSLTENAVRFQGFNLCGVVDSRIWASEKYTARFHPEYSYGFNSGDGLLLNCQLERNGVQATSSGGFYPWVEGVWIDNVKGYAASGGTVVGMSVAIPRYAVINVVSVSGDGSTMTYNVASAEGHGLTTGALVTTTAISIAGYNVTNQAVTVVDADTFTIAGTGTGSPTGQGSYVGFVRTSEPGVEFAYMSNVELYTAPAYSTAGTGILPDTSPPATWTTCDTTAHSLANGNAYRTYVSTPAWDFHTSTPA